MDGLLFARLQFGATTVYHFCFVPVSIGLALYLALMQTAWYRTGNPKYLKMVKFWSKPFLICFAMGVVTGIVLEFQIGMNWSEYSRFVGDVFGAPLAMEALLAFFLEATFIGLWVFGWDRLPKGIHLACIWCVAIGTNLSAYFIITDAAFRMLARVRTRFIAALEPLSPGILPVFRRGDLLGRMAADVDALQDLPLRVLQPAAVAAGVAALSVGVVAVLLPASAAALLTGLLVAALAVPAVTSWANRRAEAMQADARADLTATLRENLRLARPGCDDLAMREALGRARLTDWVDRLPDGLDTHLGEGGIRASEGERRRIALARALLADFPIIVFDEPTANLDPPTANALSRDLLSATADRATVLITHRLATLDIVDEIVVLNNGRVAERGTHDELLRAGGHYFRLWQYEYQRDRTDGSDDG